MRDLFNGSGLFALSVSIGAYWIGIRMKKRWKLAILNPLLIAVILVMGILVLLGLDYDSYAANAKPLTFLMTPATVALAIPLYEQIEVLKKQWRALLFGIASGVLVSALCIWAMSLIFRLDHRMYVTLLPKSVTTAIGLGVSESLGGYPAITAACIIATGILGHVLCDCVLKLFRITDPAARGVAIGTSCHAIGTARAFELGETEGAMSSLSIAVAGVLTVVAAAVFAQLI